MSHQWKSRRSGRKKIRPSKEELLYQLSQRTKLPEDILAGCCSVTVTGQNQLVIENYKSILEYQPEHLMVLTRQCRVEIFGKDLKILYYAKEEMKITGRIQQIFYHV